MKRLLGTFLLLAIVAGGAYGIWLLTADTQEAEEQVIIFDDVGVETLQDLVVVRGEVARGDRFGISAQQPATVTAIAVEADATIAAGDQLLAIDGRPMMAVQGDTPFWRALDRRVSDGADVMQLEQMLADAGFDPGTIDDDFTSSTTEALEDWQEANGYPVDGQFLPTDVAVQQWPAVVGDVLVDLGDLVGAGQPLIAFVNDTATVQLAIDATDRTRLRSGLTARVSATSSDAEATGTVSDLADAPVADAQGTERYEGEIELTSELAVAEGSAVRVEIVLEEVVDAMVVPVASVQMDAAGNEEVRILSGDGTIERRAVTTGLTEGAYVQILSGLDGSEKVIIEVRQ